MDDFLRGGSSAVYPSVRDPMGISPTLVDDVGQHLGQLDLRSPPSEIASTEWASEFGQLTDDAQNRTDVDTATSTQQHGGFGFPDLADFNRTSVQHEMMARQPMRLGPNLPFLAVDGSHPPLTVGRLSMNDPLYPLQQSMALYDKRWPNLDPPTLSTEVKGKGRMIELNDDQWEAEFARLERIQAPDRNLAPPPSSKTDAEMVTGSETLVGQDVEGLWKGLISDDYDDYFRSRFTSGQSCLADVDFCELGIHGRWDARTDSRESYVFEANNPLDGASQAYEFGVRVMAEGGNLSTAALAFEVAVQKEPSHVAAWIGLGNAQAQNEKEIAAIRALEEALRLEPFNLTALMGLAVSYTNEGMDLSAYDVLERWLTAKYTQVLPPSPDDPRDQMDWPFAGREIRYERIRDMFITAARMSPEGEAMDPDVQVGLGILFYSAEEYDKAVDCFSAALESTELRSSYARSQRHLLWNRLGATLANSGHSEEAIAAYEKALNLRPNFVRARYNLGVACINMGCYDVAAQHLLRGLVLHRVADKDERDRMMDFVRGGQTSPIHPSTKPATSENGLDEEEEGEKKKPAILEDWNNSSEILFDTLRRVLLGMGRNDLVSRVGPGMDLEAFRMEIDH